jgi:Nitrogenase molybdenum-iron protein, alpha and beta chains
MKSLVQTSLVNLNVNPCKMCMPMGAITALCGIRGCAVILHGSQGCATYIRRHMATHYNEPVDVASSSLTEQGTVFGGAENLIVGIENLIALYDPEVIGVTTTCLAETIGEDVPAILQQFRDRHPDSRVKLIHVASAGYSGTQNEGFSRSLRAVVEQTEMRPEKNGCVSLVTPMISPADTRFLKRLMQDMGLECILLPDLSETLDGGHEPGYSRLKRGGTSLEDVSRMAGAQMTVEFSQFSDRADSPAQYLNDTFGTPMVRLPLPAGLRDIDALLEVLVSCGGRYTEELKKERARYIDAMIDSHKYNAEGRAVLFGEPDFVFSTARLCCENGVVPVVAATGSVCRALEPMLREELNGCAQTCFVEPPVILDDCDFKTLEKHAAEHGANLMIGSGDGRRVAEHLGVELIRCAFPVHDRVGGQRTRTLGFEGSLQLMDRITNSLLAHKESTFRRDAYQSYYVQTGLAEKTAENPSDRPAPDGKKASRTAEEKTLTHPCFNCGAGQNARIHLPVAPACNIQCNYCVRDFDCPNESRPGVTTAVLSPEEAFEKYKTVKSEMPNLTVVGIAGPGEALANFNQTAETLRLIREYDPEVTFCLSTNGLMLPLYAQKLIDLGVTHVTVTMNAVDPEVGAQIYHHVNYLGQNFTGVAAASVLLANQLAGIKYLTEHGVVCKINTVAVRGVNDAHVPEIAKRLSDLGVFIQNVMPMISVKGAAFEALPSLSHSELANLQEACAPYVQQMHHCRQCRADAVGTLENDVSIRYRACGGKDPGPKTRRFAVASGTGALVDRHFGHVEEFYIYESDGKTARLVEKRPVNRFCTGTDECGDAQERMDLILRAVSDCEGVLCMRIGYSPAEKLKQKGIRVFSTYERVEPAVLQAAQNFDQEGLSW